MAKKKKKDNKKKSQSFSQTIRNFTLFLIKRRVYESNKTLKENEIFELTSILKEWYLDINGEFVLNYVDYLSFCNLIDYVNDIYMIAKNTSEHDFNKQFKIIRDKFLEKFPTKDTGIEYFLAINRLCSIFDRTSSKPDIDLYDKIEPLTFTIFIMSLNLSASFYKLENKKIKEFVEKEPNKVVIKYSNEKFISDEELKNINYCYLSDNINHDVLKFQSKLFLNIDNAFEKFMIKDVEDEFKDINSSAIRIAKDYSTSPFFRDNKCLIPPEEISKIPNDRRYLCPEGGIKFEIINKDLNIDSIEMIEKKDKFLFNIYLINKGGIYISKGTRTSSLDDEDIEKPRPDEKEYTDKILKIPFIISKEKFTENWHFDEILHEKMSVKIRLTIPFQQSASFTYTLLCCIYLAYYDPFRFKGNIRMYNLRRNKKGGYERTDGFRIAHLRKLPEGYNCSKEAKLEAIKAGFNNIPEGYTFVSASNGKDNKNTKKKKTILIK